MRSRTRAAVHSPLAYPQASGALERALELTQLGRAELGRAAGTLRLAQRAHSRLLDEVSRCQRAKESLNRKSQ
jgi:hypothetical protein